MRAALDRLVSWTGFLLAAVLIIAGGLLTWANSFIADQVHDQFSAQRITMPEKDALETQAQHDALDQYAGQQLETGAQAKAYADYYILVHMNEASGNKTYSEVSGEYMALTSDPNADPKAVEEMGALRQTMFMGTTLRGLLLYGYAFATIGTIAGIAAIVSFAGALVLLVLAFLGVMHARRATREETGPVGRPVATPVG